MKVVQTISFFSSTLDTQQEHKDDRSKSCIHSSNLHKPYETFLTPKIAVELVGKIVTKFPADFDYGSSLKSRYNAARGKTFHQFLFDLQVVFGNVGDNLSFQTLVNGKVQGKAEMDFGHSS